MTFSAPPEPEREVTVEGFDLAFLRRLTLGVLELEFDGEGACRLILILLLIPGPLPGDFGVVIRLYECIGALVFGIVGNIDVPPPPKSCKWEEHIVCCTGQRFPKCWVPFVEVRQRFKNSCETRSFCIL